MHRQFLSSSSIYNCVHSMWVFSFYPFWYICLSRSWAWHINVIHVSKLIAALKGTAADWIAQRASGNSGKGTEDEELQNKPQQPFQFQYKRNLAFLLYGGFYQGLFGEYLYNDIFSQLFGTDNDMLTAVKKLVFNLVVIAPFLCLPMAYIIKSFIFGKAVSAGVREYIHDVRANSLVVRDTLCYIFVFLMNNTCFSTNLHYFINCNQIVWRKNIGCCGALWILWHFP